MKLLLACVLFTVSCTGSDNIKNNSITVWKSNCKNGYFFEMEKTKENCNITFYGSFQTIDNCKIYFISKGNRIEISDSSLQFSLIDFKYSKEEIYKKDVKKLFTNADYELLVPCHLICHINKNKNKISAQIIQCLSFSSFDECIFN